MSRKMLFTMFAAMSIILVGCPVDDDDKDEDEEDEDTDSSTDDEDDGASDDDEDDGGGTDDDTDAGGTCDEGSCEDCQQCALSDECADEYDDCGADAECVEFANCAAECADQACFEACASAYPNGANMYNELVICVICDECYDTCDGAGAGC